MLRTTNFAPALTPRTCLKRTQELALRGYVSASHFRNFATNAGSDHDVVVEGISFNTPAFVDTEPL